MADETPTGEGIDGPTRRSLTRATIRAALHSNVVRKSEKYPHASSNPNDHYICSKAIRDAWHDPKAVRHVLFPADLDDALEPRIRSELLVYLSILVYIQADDFLNRFKFNFLDRQGNLTRSDEQLPLVEDDVPDFNAVDNEVLRFRFLNEQYIFMPVSRIQVQLYHRLTHCRFLSRNPLALPRSVVLNVFHSSLRRKKRCQVPLGL